MLLRGNEKEASTNIEGPAEKRVLLLYRHRDANHPTDYSPKSVIYLAQGNEAKEEKGKRGPSEPSSKTRKKRVYIK
jgi:hypothetical protein